MLIRIQCNSFKGRLKRGWVGDVGVPSHTPPTTPLLVKWQARQGEDMQATSPRSLVEPQVL